jgi:hypothetical protein
VPQRARAEVFEAVLCCAEAEVEEISRQATAEAEAIERRGEARLPALVSEALARLRETRP